ncbi:MAG: ABC transporter permease [Coriobacteriia bacterium]|nr:ABC transporter permease [Coriobacteriia bacterium]
MLTTFVTTLKTLVRNREVLLWAVAFPLVLSTLFVAMFSNLDEVHRLEPIPVVIVDDENYQAVEAFALMIELLASDEANEGSPLLVPTFVASEAAALEALEAEVYQGYIMLSKEGAPHFIMDPRRSNALGNPSQTVILMVLDQYLQNTEIVNAFIQENPALFADPSFLGKLDELLGGNNELSFTERISVTANPPSGSLRYFYAVLAFSSIMMATFALVAVDTALGNTSPLGARRSVGGQSKIRLLAPTLTAAWLLSFGCVLVGFAYLRFVFGVDFGGKEAAVVLTLAVSALAATFLGAFFGSLSIPTGKKVVLWPLLHACFRSLLDYTDPLARTWETWWLESCLCSPPSIRCVRWQTPSSRSITMTATQSWLVTCWHYWLSQSSSLSLPR